MDTADVSTYLASKGLTVHRAAGAEVTVHCVFCPDGDPKGKGRLYINQESWLYECKRCQERGNRKTLLRHFGDQDNVEALPGQDPAARRQVLEEYTEHAADLLANNDAMMSYLLRRGLSPETIIEARLGYVPKNYGMCSSLPTTFKRQDLIASGMMTDGGREYFSDRLTIPYLSHGSVLQVRGKDPNGKYFTPTGDVVRLYGIDDLRGADDVLITEGEYDRLIVKQELQSCPDPKLRRTAVVGLPGAGVLPQGFEGYFTEAKRIYLGLDPDDTGRRNAAKMKDLLGSRARIVELPDTLPKCDWSEFIGVRGNGWREVADLIGTASGRRIFSVGEAASAWRKQRAITAGIRLGYPEIDAALKPGLQPGQVCIPLAKTGTGKALRDDQVVLTEDGWQAIGTLQVGQRVRGSDGGLHDVLGVFPQGERDLYECEFSDGAVVVCDEDHLWTYRTQGGEGPWRTDTLAKIKDYARVYTPVAAPMDLPERALPIEPYLLGVLLGDGCFRQSSITLTTDDDIVKNLDLPTGVRAVRTGDNGPGVGDYRLSGKQGLSNPIIEALRALELWGHGSLTKSIPSVYLQGSVSQRRALLAGLLDTDGSVDPRTGSIEYGTSSPTLAHDVQALVSSLGGVCRVHRRSTTHADAYRLTPVFGDGPCPLRLPRKAALWSPSRRPTRRLVSVRPAGRANATCIAVSAPDRLFVTEGFVLTHNTVFLANVAYNCRSRRVLIISLEMTAVEVFELLQRIWRFHNPFGSLDEMGTELANVRIVDENRLNEKDVEALVAEYTEDVGAPPELIELDYLGYFARGMRGGDSYERTGNAVMAVKAIAKSCGAAVIAPHQVNRGAEDGKPLSADDARDSGVIEETGDFVFGLFKPDEARDVANAGQAGAVTGNINLSFLKSRHGGKGKVFPLKTSAASLVIVSPSNRKAVARVDMENARINAGEDYEAIYASQSQQQLTLVKGA